MDLKTMIWCTLAFLVSLVHADGTGCAPNNHSVSVADLPYVDGELHDCQYAGTFSVSHTEDHNLFYWFFRHSDPNAPLILWLNGGPGATSMNGLFLENGPLRVVRNGTGADDFKLSAAE